MWFFSATRIHGTPGVVGEKCRWHFARPERDGARHAEKNFQQEITFGRVASGISQGKLLFKTCFERCSFGPAECGRAPPAPPNRLSLLTKLYCYNFAMKRKKIVPAIVIISILAAGIIGLLYFRKTTVAKNTITGTVKSVTNRPNVAENGYYGFEVQDNSGRKYTVDATGYLNTPVPPDRFGVECVEVPKVKVGNKVEFNLPKSEGQQDTFNNCYKENVRGYYFKVD